MAALKRGIPHYADGVPDVPVSAPAPPSMDQYLLNQQVQRRDAPAPAPAAPSAFGQLLSGVGSIFNSSSAPGDANLQFKAAQQNPTVSPATSAIAGFMDHVTKNIRAQNLAAPPAPID